MPHQDWFILMVMGGSFVLLGLAAILWGRAEERKYYDSLSTRIDVREYLERWPPRIEPGAIKLGGWITVILGLFMLALGAAFLLWR